jgi:predicted DNA-binding protein (MmcQ/YjbR family)
MGRRLWVNEGMNECRMDKLGIRDWGLGVDGGLGWGETLGMGYTADDARTHVMGMKEVTEETPFGPDVLVYKVMGKMFATLGFEDEVGRMNLKCDPERALELRDEYEAIIPGYHMNKKHWNTLVLDGSLDGKLVMRLIEDSYDLVVGGLPKKLRDDLGK